MATLIQSLQRVLERGDPMLPNQTRRIRLKAALQAYVLDFLYNHRFYRRLNFYGGTCLRVIYDLNRLSEDIDLDNGREVDINSLADDLREHFHARLAYRDLTISQRESGRGIVRITLKFPLLYTLGLSPHRDEKLHLKLEVSGHRQVAELKSTPVIYFGRSFVPSHFSLETMMAGKILACLERSFQVGATGTRIKGRDFYDLLWFMGQQIQPLEEKLAQDSAQPYTVKTAMGALQEKVATITPRDLAVDLLPLFEQRSFIEAWIETFHDTFEAYTRYYVG